MTLLEINKAINSRIETAKIGTPFATVPLLAEDLAEPIKRPSLKVQIEDSTSSKFNACCKEHNLTCRVHFFAPNGEKPKMDNLLMREILENAFLDDLIVVDGTIPIEEVRSTITDGVLICSFDLYRVELIPDTDTSPFMDKLNINERVI